MWFSFWQPDLRLEALLAVTGVAASILFTFNMAILYARNYNLQFIIQYQDQTVSEPRVLPQRENVVLKRRKLKCLRYGNPSNFTSEGCSVFGLLRFPRTQAKSIQASDDDVDSPSGDPKGSFLGFVGNLASSATDIVKMK